MPAPKLKPVPLDRAFVASILRSQAKLDDQEIQAKVRKIVEPLRIQYQQEAERNWRNRRGENESLKDELKKIQEATGIDILSWGSSLDSGLIEAIKFAQRAGLTSDYSALRHARDNMERAVKNIDAALGSPLSVEEKL
jgi:glucosamine 6-phosphate synthetase-like amidotransferase/phosphosugar isomerase protein